jgi:CRP/FNR family transcriptional regulator, cyclic AMP receptor protein
VVEAGSKPESLYLILSGNVSVETTDADGNELLLAYMFPRDFFGEMGLFADVGARSARIRARSDCLLLEVAYPAFLELAQAHPALWLELSGQLAARLRAVNRQLAALPSLNVAERVWRVLLELAERSDAPRLPQGRVIRLTREELGRLAGCSRDVVGLALRDFERAGRVQRVGHRLVVLDGTGQRAEHDDR